MGDYNSKTGFPDLSVLAKEATLQTEPLLDGITSSSPIKRAWTAFKSVSDGTNSVEFMCDTLKRARHELSYAGKFYIGAKGGNPTQNEVKAYHILKSALNTHRDLAVDLH